MAKFQKLFSPVRIGPVSIKNRIAMAALHTNFAAQGEAGERLLAFYQRRAQGGVGLVMVGMANSEPPNARSSILDFSSDEALPSFSQLTQTVHAYGAKIGIQLTPGAFYNQPSLRPAPDQIPALLQHLAEAARRAQKAGFDVVELMASGGSLASYFLSPVHNTWQIPGYSGSPAQRLRFATEAVSALRSSAGPGMAVTVRIHGHEFLPGGYGITEATAHAQALVRAGADAINVTGGGHTTVVPQITQEVPRGAFLYLARAIRRAISAPVFASNRIHDPWLAETLLRRGDADLVNMPRSLVADPDWPRKVQEGVLDEIRPCIACCHCLDCIMAQQPIECSVNSEVGHEHEPAPPRLPHSTRALVAGGGVAGCEAAWRLAQQGARVTLAEASDTLGGKLALASMPPGREEIGELQRYYQNILPKIGVEVKLHYRITPSEALAAKPDIMVLAVGGQPLGPAVEQMEHANVVYVEQVLRREVDVGQKVVVLGAGGTGIEAALFVASGGALDPATLAFLVCCGAQTPESVAALANLGKTVTLCCRGLKIGSGLGRSTRWTLIRQLDRLGVRKMPGARYVRLDQQGLLLRYKNGQETLVEADTVIVACGCKPDPMLLNQFEGCAGRIFLVGDALDVGNIRRAISDVRRQLCVSPDSSP